MSESGSLRWWQDTALVTLAGVALAVWLWDGWPFVFFVTDTIAIGAPEPDLGDYFDAGCVTVENLRAMADGRATTISCVEVRLTHTPDAPQAPRLLP